MVATNLILAWAQIALTKNDLKEYENTLLIKNIRAITALKPNKNMQVQKYLRKKFLLG